MNAYAAFPPDPALPTLATALNPGEAAEAFAAGLRNAGVRVRSLSCQIDHVRLARGRTASIGYRLECEAEDSEPFTQLAMARVSPPALIARWFEEAAGRQLVPTSAGPALMRLDELGAVAWMFPNDAKLPLFSDPFGRDALSCFMDDDESMVTSSAELVRYVPEQACTARLIVSTRGPDGDLKVRRAFATCRADGCGRRAHSVQSAIVRRFGLDGPAALPLAYDPDRRTFWQVAAEGQALCVKDVATQPRSWAARIGDTLKDLQTVRPPALPVRTFEDVITIASAGADSAAAVSPACAARLSALVRQLRNSVPAETARVLTHGELHASNIRADGAILRLVDFDGAALGDPLADRASLVAALVDRGYEAGLDDLAVARIIDAFRPRRRVAAYHWLLVASLLGERLYRRGTRLRNCSARSMERLLDVAAAVLPGESPRA